MARLSTAQVQRRRIRVGELWLRGYSMRDIAEQIRKEAANPNSRLAGLDKTNYVIVYKDVAKLRTWWIQRDFAELSQKRSQQISRIFDIIHQAWVNYEYDAAQRPKYLHIMLEAEEMLAKLTGTMAPVQVTGAEGEPLVPRTLRLFLADGTVLKPPRNGQQPLLKEASGGNSDGK